MTVFMRANAWLLWPVNFSLWRSACQMVLVNTLQQSFDLAGLESLDRKKRRRKRAVTASCAADFAAIDACVHKRTLSLALFFT
jgi:hypothetical protein